MSKLNLLRRVDLYLRNEHYTDPSADHELRSLRDRHDENPKDDPLRTRVYWGIRRFWTNHWLCNPSTVYFDAKCAYQRVVRGWDDRAVWSIDCWLDEKMPDMLRQLKKTEHGTPMSMFEKEDLDEDGYDPTEEGHVRAHDRWDAVLDKMIAGFEASRRIKDMTYDEAPPMGAGPYPLFRPADVSKADWKKVKDDHFALSEKLRARDEGIFKEGMALFVEHYWSLWD